MKTLQMVAILAVVTAANANESFGQTRGGDGGSVQLPDYVLEDLEEAFHINLAACQSCYAEAARLRSVAQRYPQFYSASNRWQISATYQYKVVTKIAQAWSYALSCGGRLSYKQKLHIKSILDETYWDRGSAGWAAWNAAREMGNDFDHPALLLIEDAHDKIELLVIVIDPSSP